MLATVSRSDFQKITGHNGSETVDLGIKGRRAIVCASSKGLGRACAMALANEGVHVTLTARGAEVLKKTADRKSTRLNSSHLVISYAVFCLKKKKKQTT